MNFYNDFNELPGATGYSFGANISFNPVETTHACIVLNMTPSTGLLFDGNIVHTHSSEQGHGGKLEPEHAEVTLQDYGNGKVKVWFMKNGKQVVELADYNNRVPERVAREFERFCIDNEPEIRKFHEKRSQADGRFHTGFIQKSRRAIRWQNDPKKRQGK